jgi:membrane protease YdiL (CAAX protease family)
MLSSEALVRSGAALVPLLAWLGFGMTTRWAPLVRLREQVGHMVRSTFGRARWWSLAALAASAGVGEELFFRGALQPLAERWLGAAAGLAVVSVVFGALHASSSAYFLLATAVGVYLGWLAQHFNDLAAPILVHAAYDLVALWAFCRRSAGATE